MHTSYFHKRQLTLELSGYKKDSLQPECDTAPVKLQRYGKVDACNRENYEEVVAESDEKEQVLDLLHNRFLYPFNGLWKLFRNFLVSGQQVLRCNEVCDDRRIDFTTINQPSYAI